MFVCVCLCVAGWCRYIRCLNIKVYCRKRATNYWSLLRKMTYKHKASYASSPPSSCAYSQYAQLERFACVREWICASVNEWCVCAWCVCEWLVRMWMIGAYVNMRIYSHFFFFPCSGVKKDAWSSVWKGGEKKTLEVVPFQIVSYSNVFISILSILVPLSMSHFFTRISLRVIGSFKS